MTCLQCLVFYYDVGSGVEGLSKLFPVTVITLLLCSLADGEEVGMLIVPTVGCVSATFLVPL